MTQQFIVQGRIVWGHPGKLSPKKDARTKQTVMKDGQPVMQCAFGLAIDKNTFNAQVWPMLANEARAAFPNGAPQNFTYKFKDGDSIDASGKPYGSREGYAGHCVLTISTQGFAPQLFKMVNGQYVQMSAEEIKCGDYVAVNVTIKYNGATSPNTPGLYVNPNAVVHIGYGTEITSAGQDPDELFQGFQAQQFAGMSATPMLPNNPLPGAMQPGQPAQPQYDGRTAQPGYGAAPQAAPAGYAPQPQYGAPAQPAQLPPPAHDFVNNATGQAPQPQYGMPAGAPAAQGAPAGYAPAQPQYGAPAAAPAGYAPQPQYGAPAQPQYGQPGQMPGMPAGR